MLAQCVHENQKSALMKATVKAVAEDGLENLSTRGISAQCGVSEVYIYRYFKNKEDLIARVFAYADEEALKVILGNFSVMECEEIEYEMRCRMLFEKCWEYIMSYPEWLIFYVRYYYSASFQKYSYEEHIRRYGVLTDRMKPGCHPAADVDTVLHHILETMLGQARKQIMHPRKPEQAKEDAFGLVLSVLKCGKGI